MKLLAAATLLLAPFGASAQRPSLMGFSVERSEQQRAWEAVMAAVPDAARMREAHREMTRRPHYAGTDENYRLALELRDLWQELGFDTEMVRYDALVPWPGDLRLRLVAPEVLDLAVTEPPVPDDPDTSVEGALPGVAAYVTPGDVEGDVIYANYGRIGDYRLLDDLGVSLEGKIVLVRYGGTPNQMRGMKVREAARRGAIGVVIYSDPEEDGYVRGEGRLQELLRAIGAANAQLRVAAVQADVVVSQVLAGGEAWTDANAQTLGEVNRLIMQAERELLDERGLWRRPWYRNLVYAPGYYEGYAAKTLPGVREAMEAGEWDVARTQAGMLVEALGRAATVLTNAGDTARRAVPRRAP